jgi:hypothetical protein
VFKAHPKLKFIKNPYFWAVTAVLFLGIFLRAYHFRELLFFEVDQARDWRIVEIACQYGIGELPLLGPGMNASSFRIGPIYHYIQYVAALIFGNTPEGLAYPDLLFSISAIPLFYFFSKEYFSRRISAILSLFLAISLFAIEYGRFAMNSNSLPFFTLLALYPLLRLSRENNRLRRWAWIATSAFSLGIIMQLHALTMVAMPLLILLYLFITKTRLIWKEWLVAVSIIIILSLPMVISEYMSNFQDFRAIATGVSTREDNQQNFSFNKRLIKNSQEIIRNYTLILTSKNIIPSLDEQFMNEGGLDMIKRNFKDPEGRKGLLYSFLSFIFFLIPALWLANDFFHLEKNDFSKRNFLILLFLWQMIYLLLFLNFLYIQHTRYYLTVIFIPFILLGAYLKRTGRKWHNPARLAMLFIFLTANIVFVGAWFNMVEKYDSPDIQSSDIKEYINDPYYLATYEQISEINNYLKNYYRENPREIVLMSPNTFYTRSISYLLIYNENIPVRNFSNSLRYKEKSYFFIAPINYSGKETSLFPRKYEDDFEIFGEKSFGTLTVYQIKIKDAVSSVPAPQKEDKKQNNNRKGKLADKYTWNKFFKYIKNENT